MATQSLNNPFADFGGIVHGDRFIGRKEAIAKITERVLGLTTYGNLAIMGLPRVGKSSLAWHAIMDRKAELLEKNTIPVFFESGSCVDSNGFFKKMVTLLHDELELVCEDEKYQKNASKIIETLNNSFEKDLVQKYFKLVKRIGFKTIYIFDEFDSVSNFFDKADFQLLRELSYNPDTHLCLVTCSRKTIEDIEVKDGAISNFAGTCSDLRLGMFSNEDVSLYWEYFGKCWEVDDTYKSVVSFYTGGHPWLMDKVNSKMFNTDISPNNLVARFDDVKLELMEVLDTVVGTIEKDRLLDTAIQVVVGPLYDLDQRKVEKLLKYGFIKKVKQEYKAAVFGGAEVGPSWDGYSYTCFSEYSTRDFYRRYYANTPYVAIWSETENELRKLIKTYLAERYSQDWESEMQQYLTNNLPYKGFKISYWAENVQRLKNNMNDMIATFPTMRGNHIVDFTLTSQIFDIFIKWDWSWFGNVFKGQKMDWHNKFDHLVKVRNPVAHNNPGDINAEMDLARTYCEEIKKSIVSWQNIRTKTHVSN